MKKYIISIIIITSMLGLSACGNDGKPIEFNITK